MPQKENQRPLTELGPRCPEDQLALRESALAVTAEGVTIADARLPDNPIIYANEGFERLTGYSVQEVIGRNCRFLQGPGTHADTVSEIRDAVRQGQECTVQLLNYRKDGTPFWNRLSITPLRNVEGDLTHFVGIQSDITRQKYAEDALRQANEKLEAANQRLVRDLDAAAKIQRSLLPSLMPQVPGVTFAWEFRPCSELAGDILNIHPLDQRNLALYVIDVSGHGVAAALFAVTLSRLLSAEPNRYSLFGPADKETSENLLAAPAQVAERLNRQFPFDSHTGQYFTMLYGVLNLDKCQFRYVSAGHAGPVRVTRQGDPEDLTSGGFPIGLVASADYEERVLPLEPGDRLYLFTDGITEAENSLGQEFGTARLLDAIRNTNDLQLSDAGRALVANVESWCGGTGLKDDVSILACQISSQ